MVTRFEDGQKRTAIASRSISLALVATTVGMAAIATAFFVSQGSSPATTNALSSSSSLLSSSSVLSSSSSSVKPAAQYPLVWAPNSPTEGSCDTMIFCVYARLGFAATATVPPPPPPPPITVIQDNTTTIVISSTTTYISGVSTGVVYPPENGSYSVAVFALVQDAVTGQNVTTSSSLPYFGGGCLIQEFGYTECIDPGWVPAGHTYKVTVFVTKGDLPCSLRPANHPDLPCESQLLAPIQTLIVLEPSDSTSTTVTSSTSSVSNPAYCSDSWNTLLNPAPKGTVYMKVVTDQGAAITNGSLLVTQVGNYTGSWTGWGLTAHYCISLGDVNGTGYLQLGANMTFLTSGYYNVTLVAGYNQGPGYQATIPSILVTPNSTIYVTVSVPSGVVTVVTSNEGSSTVITTTTSATTIKSGG